MYIGVVSTVAGVGGVGHGYVDGMSSVARFYLPFGIASLSTGDLVIADNGNNAVRSITSTGVVWC